MAALSYLDSSAIVKLVVREPESDALETYMINREGLVSSRLCEPEVFRTARRVGARKAQQLEAQARDALDALFLRDVDADVLYRADFLAPPALKTLDAIHLATALTMGDPELEFVTYDERLARAAEGAGLRVVQPGMPARSAPSGSPHQNHA